MTAVLQDVIVKAPWDTPDVLYPPPHPVFLQMHYFTSIAKAMNMKGDGDDYELDDDEDDEELSEPGDIQDDEVKKIWIDSDGEIMAPWDCTVEN